ncbi:DUF4113 domain-containing protein [Escherichia coli]
MSTVYHRPADPSGDDSYVRPLFADRCQAGFPSPATDYAEQELDLNSYCISRPAATFFLRASSESMNQAVVQYAERAAEKLRGERQYCRQVTTFVRTSPFAVKEPCYSNAAVEKLSLPTQDSRDIIAAACRALNHVWREGYRYMKAGVMLADFTPSGIAQPGLFDEIQPRKNSEKLMKTLDELNQSGKGKVWFAGRGTAPEWQMKREMLSPAYTTRWTDLPVAQL